MNELCRCEALDERLEAMRAERRPHGDVPADLLARHAAEVEGLAMQLASFKVHHLSGFQQQASCMGRHQSTIVESHGQSCCLTEALTWVSPMRCVK